MTIVAPGGHPSAQRADVDCADYHVCNRQIAVRVWLARLLETPCVARWLVSFAGTAIDISDHPMLMLAVQPERARAKGWQRERHAKPGSSNGGGHELHHLRRQRLGRVFGRGGAGGSRRAI